MNEDRFYHHYSLIISPHEVILNEIQDLMKNADVLAKAKVMRQRYHITLANFKVTNNQVADFEYCILNGLEAHRPFKLCFSNVCVFKSSGIFYLEPENSQDILLIQDFLKSAGSPLCDKSVYMKPHLSLLKSKKTIFEPQILNQFKNLKFSINLTVTHLKLLKFDPLTRKNRTHALIPLVISS